VQQGFTVSLAHVIQEMPELLALDSVQHTNAWELYMHLAARYVTKCTAS